jgi:hypothetical protein
MSERTVSVVVGPGAGTDRQKAEVSVVNGHIWLTFLGPRGGRQYTLPLSPEGSDWLGTMLRHAAKACGYDREAVRPLNDASRDWLTNEWQERDE